MLSKSLTNLFRHLDFKMASSPDELLIAIDCQWLIHMEVYELPRR